MSKMNKRLAVITCGCSLVGHLSLWLRALLGINHKFAVRKVVG